MKNYLLLVILSALFFFIQSCDDTVDSPQYYIAGTVTFTDTHISSGSGYYAISIYADTTEPYQRAPIVSDSLVINVSGNTATATYRVNNVPSGTYHVGATWICTQTERISGVLGIYGCDTARSCMGNHISIPNFSGSNECNFISWTDTLKKLY